MNRFKKAEILILILLWLASILSYSIALLKSHVLLNSDLWGLMGLVTLTLVVVVFPKYIFESLFILLLLGLFNVVSFVSFFNYVLTFKILGLNLPEIQLVSLICLSILVVLRRHRLREIYWNIIGESDKAK